MPRGLRALLATATGLAAVVLLAFLLVMAVLGPVIWGDAASKTHLTDVLHGASSTYPFGTDELGRDIFARTLSATRLSLLLAFLASLIAVSIGLPLGTLPSVLGPRLGRLVTGAIGASIAFPSLLTALFVSTIIGIGATGAVIGIGLAGVPMFARLAQTMSASVASLDYVAAARTLGVSRRRILFRHILPNVAEPLAITATLSVAYSLLGISALSFLGLGVRPPSYDWGGLLSSGLKNIYLNPMSALGPAAFIVLAGITFSLLGESVARTFTDGGATQGTRRATAVLSRARRAAAKRRSATPAATRGKEAPLLDVRGLTVAFPGENGVVTPVRGVDLAIHGGEKVGIVGESGSGKSLTVMAVAQLIAEPGHADWQRLRFAGRELSELSPAQQRSFLGTSLAMIFQDPMSSLNPTLRIGRQLSEVAEVHAGTPKAQALQQAAVRLGEVGIPGAAERLKQYPHEFSGGMRQRAMIAMGIMEAPKLIIADEPTTALDVTVQRQILDLLQEINATSGAAILLISHDIAVVTTVCERVMVMYAGHIVEELSSEALVRDAAHPYTRALLAAVPDMATDRDRPLATIPGRPPAVDVPVVGCPYASRCTVAVERCHTERPELTVLDDGHRVACWKPQATGTPATGGSSATDAPSEVQG